MKPWMKKIQRGDILRSRSGTIRVVREVSYWKKSGSEHLCVTFLIRRCSWTHRPHTIYDANLLKQYGFKPTGIRMSLKSQFDKAVEEEISRVRKVKPPILTCCDVIGIP